MQGKQLDLFDEHSSKASAGPGSRPERQQGHTWGWLLFVIALITSGGYFLFPSQTTAESETQPASSLSAARSIPVRVTQAEPVSSYNIRREYTGTVQAARASELGFERAGKLVQLSVDEGESVQAGQAIAQLDIQNLQAQRQLLQAQKAGAEAVLQELQNGPRQEEIAAAKSRVAELQDQLALEQTKRVRREDLYQQGAIAREDLDEIAFAQAALSDRLAATRSQLQELETGTRPERVMAQQAAIAQLNAQLSDLDITIEKSILRAPYNGVIGDRHVDEGTVLNAGQGVVRLVEGASPEVEIGVPETVAETLNLGKRQSIEIGGQIYNAELVAIKPEIDSATRTRPLILQLESSALTTVVPQQIARLELSQEIPVQGYWLPLTALARGDRGLWSAYAVVETSDNMEQQNEKAKDRAKSLSVERRDLEVLYTESDALSGGAGRALVRGMLDADDRIIESGIQRIVPGQQVEVISVEIPGFWR